ncbi:hypothetical protein [Bradyrhizobium diazoefficiens]
MPLENEIMRGVPVGNARLNLQPCQRRLVGLILLAAEKEELRVLVCVLLVTHLFAAIVVAQRGFTAEHVRAAANHTMRAPGPRLRALLYEQGR